MSLFTCGLLWCFYSYSDSTHSLQMIHWWASDVMLNFSKSVPIKKWTHLQLGWPESDYIFNYFLSIPLIIKGALSKFLSEFSWILLIPKVPLTLILFRWVTCRYPEPYYSYRLSTGAGAGAGARPRMALVQNRLTFPLSNCSQRFLCSRPAWFRSRFGTKICDPRQFFQPQWKSGKCWLRLHDCSMYNVFVVIMYCVLYFVRTNGWKSSIKWTYYSCCDY